MNIIKSEIFFSGYCEDFPCKIDSKKTYINFTDMNGNKVNIPVQTILKLYEKIQNGAKTNL